MLDHIGQQSIIFNAPVEQIENVSDGVEVVYRTSRGESRKVRADYCICAVPPNMLTSIRSNFHREVKKALGIPAPQSAGKLGIEYGRRWWEEDDRIYGGTTYTNLELTLIEYPSWGYHGQRGIIHGYYNFDEEADLYGRLSPAQRVKRAVPLGEKIHGPNFGSGIESTFSVAWQKTRYSQGAWFNWPVPDVERPGNGNRDFERLLEPDGKVYFAGDYLSQVNAWQAGAILSARKVVTDLHSHVLASCGLRDCGPSSE
jgi:monoamine oxidase